MRAFFAVNLFFVAANALFAGAIYATFKLGQFVFPAAMENAWFVFVFGTAVLAAFVWFMKWSMGMIDRLIGARRSRKTARAPA